MEHWEIKRDQTYELGIDGLSKRERIGRWITPFINVSSVDQYVDKIESISGKIFQLKTAISKIGYNLLFKDTESNTIGLFEQNTEAK